MCATNKDFREAKTLCNKEVNFCNINWHLLKFQEGNFSVLFILTHGGK